MAVKRIFWLLYLSKLKPTKIYKWKKFVKMCWNNKPKMARFWKFQMLVALKWKYLTTFLNLYDRKLINKVVWYKIIQDQFWAVFKVWLDGWVDGRMGVKAVSRISYKNHKSAWRILQRRLYYKSNPTKFQFSSFVKRY